MKKPKCKKKPIKSIRIVKKLTGSVRFGLISLKTKNQTKHKLITESNRKKSTQTKTKPIRNYKKKTQKTIYFLVFNIK